MKKGKLFSTFALAFLAIGVGASLIGTHDVVRADALAEEPAVAQKVYLDTSETGWWHDGGVVTFAWCKNGGNYANDWSTKFTPVKYNLGIYEAELPVTGNPITTLKLAGLPKGTETPGDKVEGIKFTEELAVDFTQHNAIKMKDGGWGNLPKLEKANITLKDAPVGIKSGEKMYFDTKTRERHDNDPFSIWTDAKAKIALQVTSFEGTTFTKFMTPATGALEGIDNMLEVVLPQINGQDVVFYKVIIGRFDPSTEEGKLSFDDGKYWAKSKDIVFGENGFNVVFTYNSDNGGNVYWSGYQTSADYESATNFAKGFNEAISVICQNDGSTDAEALTAGMNAQKAIFDKLSEGAKNIVRHNSRGSKGELQKALERYDYIVRRYANEVAVDFLGRRPQDASNGLSMIEDYTTLIIVATVVAVAAISVIAVVAIRKKQLSK